MNVIFQEYSDKMVNRTNKETNQIFQAKEGFKNIPLIDKWMNLSKEDKHSIIHRSDRIVVEKSTNPEEHRTRLQSFANQIGFKGSAKVGGKDKDYIFCNRRPGADTAFETLSADPDLADLPSLEGFGSR